MRPHHPEPLSCLPTHSIPLWQSWRLAFFKLGFNIFNTLPSVHGILRVRILEWVAIPFSRGSSWPRCWTQVCNTQVLQADSLLWAPRKPYFILSHKGLSLAQCFCNWTSALKVNMSTSGQQGSLNPSVSPGTASPFAMISSVWAWVQMGPWCFVLHGPQQAPHPSEPQLLPYRKEWVTGSTTEPTAKGIKGSEQGANTQ